VKAKIAESGALSGWVDFAKKPTLIEVLFEEARCLVAARGSGDTWC